MKKIISTFLAVTLLAIGMVGCGSKTDSGSANTKAPAKPAATAKATPAASSSGAEASTETLKGKHHVEITVKDYGTIKCELDADTAPITVTNFVNLAKSGFYDGLTFHRIIEGFMIQGGDPQGTGMGGSDKTIKGEFSANGVTNNISHKKGTISMARSQMPDSASSQFFICQADCKQLDGQYAAFGNVTSGIEIVDKIAKDAKVTDNNGSVAKADQPVITSIKVVD